MGLFYSRGHNLYLSLFILMAKLSQSWPAGVSLNWLYILVTCHCHSSTTCLLSGSSYLSLLQLQNLLHLQRVLVPMQDTSSHEPPETRRGGLFPHLFDLPNSSSTVLFHQRTWYMREHCTTSYVLILKNNKLVNLQSKVLK